MKVAMFLAAPAVALAVAVGGSFDAGTTVKAGEFGEAWPLTVPKGIVRCETGGEITFQTDGTTFTLTRSPGDSAYSDISAIRTTGVDGPMDLGPLVERGVRLCD